MKKTSLLILAVLFSVSLVAQCEIHNKVLADGSMLYCPDAFSGFEVVSADIILRRQSLLEIMSSNCSISGTSLLS
ncbi:hypothetical protein [Flavobacterium poyangense]|uniref:hypothetical protein n=1 Tax=Flavobacterium poyangense TaxID=2204302 RepID=UPI0014241B26|nr:hypothetical protein [Flavobacterium sp. JXAS1]